MDQGSMFCTFPVCTRFNSVKQPHLPAGFCPVALANSSLVTRLYNTLGCRGIERE